MWSVSLTAKGSRATFGSLARLFCQLRMEKCSGLTFLGSRCLPVRLFSMKLACCESHSTDVLLHALFGCCGRSRLSVRTGQFTSGVARGPKIQILWSK